MKLTMKHGFAIVLAASVAIGAQIVACSANLGDADTCRYYARQYCDRAGACAIDGIDDSCIDANTLACHSDTNKHAGLADDLTACGDAIKALGTSADDCARVKAPRSLPECQKAFDGAAGSDGGCSVTYCSSNSDCCTGYCSGSSCSSGPRYDSGVPVSPPDATTDGGCSACSATYCKSAAAACSADSNCMKGVTCLGSCQGRTDKTVCENNCLSSASNSNLYGYYGCLSSSCKSECGL